MKKTKIETGIAILLVITLLMISGKTAGAQSLGNSPVTTQAVLYSAEYPEAYIKTEIRSKTINSQDTFAVIESTVFVEESYEYIDDSLIITESRLLSEPEVQSIGEDNFVSITSGSRSTTYFTPVTIARAKLSITSYVHYTTNGTGITISCESIAHWNTPGLIPLPINNPAAGEDIFGFAWYGYYSVSSHSCERTWNYFFDPDMLTSYVVQPNVAFAYTFEEAMTINQATAYAEELDLNLTLQKNVLTGGGNEADLVMQYIHTYQTISGSLNLSYDSFGITLNGVEKQWTLTSLFSGIPY